MGRPRYQVSSHCAELKLQDRVVLSIDPLAGVARGCFPKSFVDDRSTFRLHALHFALSAALPAQGFLGVHAVCIAQNGRSVLLRGPHGIGKSVLAYAAIARGFRVIAGSTVWIASDDKTWWGIPRWMHLRHSARFLLPDMPLGQEVSVGDQVKIEIDLAEMLDCSTKPGAIVFLDRISKQSAELQVVTQSEALSLWNLGKAGNEANAPDYKARVERLLMGRNYRLNLSNDLDRGVNLIAAAAQGQPVC